MAALEQQWSSSGAALHWAALSSVCASLGFILFVCLFGLPVGLLRVGPTGTGGHDGQGRAAMFAPRRGFEPSGRARFIFRSGLDGSRNVLAVGAQKWAREGKI